MANSVLFTLNETDIWIGHKEPSFKLYKFTETLIDTRFFLFFFYLQFEKFTRWKISMALTKIIVTVIHSCNQIIIWIKSINKSKK